MQRFFAALLACTVVDLSTSLNLRHRGSGGGKDQFGCTADQDQACIKVDLLPPPDKINPSTATTQVNDAGFVIADVMAGDDGTDGDPGPAPKKEKDPAEQYMIDAPYLEDPPPLPALIVCATPEDCTTTTTTLPPGMARQ